MEYNIPREPNQLYRELLSASAFNPWDGHNSSSRKQMAYVQNGQRLVTTGMTERIVETGMGVEYQKYLFDTKMPADAEVIRVIDRYRKTHDSEHIDFNPQTIIIYEDVNTKEVGIVDIRHYKSNHSYFGYPLIPTEKLNNIYKGAFIPKDTLLMRSPGYTENGTYKYGVQTNVAFMTMPGVAEDGIVISDKALDKFSFHIYESRVVEFGASNIPLNLYGDDDHYKIFPDIGEYVREDSLLMALREHDDLLSPIIYAKHFLKEYWSLSDKPTYVSGPGRVVDIIVHHDPFTNQPRVPAGMETQARKYYNHKYRFFQEILDEYNRLRSIRKDALQITPEFHRLIIEALSVLESKENTNVQKSHRQAPLDDWRIEFVIERLVKPNIGFKMTGQAAGKGVIVEIKKEEEMPIDDFGNRAEIIMDPLAFVSRIILGTPIEHKYSAVQRDLVVEFRERLGLTADQKVNAKFLQSLPEEAVEMCWSRLMRLYEIMSPMRMFKWFRDGEYKGSKYDHLAEVINAKVVSLYLPPENEPETIDISLALDKEFPIKMSPVTYIGNSGQKIRTKENILVSSMYMLLLDKVGNDGASVASAKLQHYGVISHITNSDKYKHPTRLQGTRAHGEAEFRIYNAFTSPFFRAEIMDRNNNRLTHEAIYNNILRAPQPTNVKCLVDRKEIPYGGVQPLNIFKHLAACAGWTTTYEPYKETWKNKDYENYKRKIKDAKA